MWASRKIRANCGKILRDTGLAVKITSNIHKALKKADVDITVTSGVDSIIDVDDLKPGAVVCRCCKGPRMFPKEVAEK